MHQKQKFSTIDQAAKALANHIGEELREAIQFRGKASLAVSGGSTPKYVFQHLLTQDVDWSKVTLTLTDERWVSTSDSESNEKLVRGYLLKGTLCEAEFVPFFGGESSPEEGKTECETRLSAIAQPFDVIYLGMGEDGHFASLFPNENAMDAHDEICVAVPETPSRLPRMSLTTKTILQAKKVFLLFSGKEKHQIYAKAQAIGATKNIPVSVLLSQKQLPLVVLTAP